MSRKPKKYDVGYGKPPKANRFQKGKSGNPRGRPKGAGGLKQDIERELSIEVQVTENGKPLKTTKQQLVIKRLTTDAAQGDRMAAFGLLELLRKLGGGSEPEPGGARPQNEEDQKIIDDFIQRALKNHGIS